MIKTKNIFRLFSFRTYQFFSLVAVRFLHKILVINKLSNVCLCYGSTQKTETIFYIDLSGNDFLRVRF